MTRLGNREGASSLRRWGGLAVVAVLAALAPRATAGETEHRTFAIFVDGKQAGENLMVIERRDDGTEVVSHNARVYVKQLLKYEYSYRGTEMWQAGRLVGLHGTCNDNGTVFEVRAAAEGKQLRVVVNNQERLIEPDVWTTSFWKLADARFQNRSLTVLDSDRGKELSRQLQLVATEQMAVAGQTQNCQHFRVVGGLAPIELWFDANQRLVRQDFVELGHRTVIQLTSVRR